jgi:rhamnosyltransferase subunit A
LWRDDFALEAGRRAEMISEVSPAIVARVEPAVRSRGGPLETVIASGDGGFEMRTERVVGGILGRYAIHVEHHGSPHAKGTIILVNGALGTTTAFAQTIKYLLEAFNVVAYDLPFAGKSKRHNSLDRLLTQEEEIDILLALIREFQCEHVLSLSWGSVAALLGLARRPRGIKSAIAVSFSPVVNEKFRAYMQEMRTLIHTPEGRITLGHVVNETVGRHLPGLIKRSNFRHISLLTDLEYAQIELYIDQVNMLDAERYVERCAAIEVPLMFVNGGLDEYTVASDVRLITRYVPHSRFAVIDGAGHFLDLESRAARAKVRAAILGFLGAPVGAVESAA